MKNAKINYIPLVIHIYLKKNWEL